MSRFTVLITFADYDCVEVSVLARNARDAKALGRRYAASGFHDFPVVEVSVVQP